MTFSRFSRASFFVFLFLLLGKPIEAEPVQITLHAGEAVREPISKYVYGQFIEHLGRCIYGGLWAEMLEDRKFYYPLTGEMPAWETFTPGESSWEGEGHPYELLVRSPWMIIGPKSSISMNREKAYVGEHTPQVELSSDDSHAGIAQGRLSLVSGREYVGRVVLAGDLDGSVAVSLVWGGGASDRKTVVLEPVPEGYSKFPFKFRAGRTTDGGRLEIVVRGTGSVRIGTVSLMPSDNILGWRADTVARLKELDAPVYRWPGGNFVSGYDWKDGIGDPDLRPPRKNPAWKGIEHNDVGLHEFLFLCREIGAEPYIAVNTGLGGAEGAAEEVEYTNGSLETPMGKLRAENGHPEPFRVRWWAVGNEMYGEWQLGHMPLERYVLKHNEVVDAMRAVDPSISPVAVGSVGDWSRQMLTSCPEHMSLISEHLYWQDREALEDHVFQLPDGVRGVAEAHRKYRQELAGLAGKDIRIALDEWNYWYGPNEFGELGTQYFLQDGLGIAAGLHELFRHSDLFFMANYAQTVNVIGAIKTNQVHAEFEATGLVLQMYRENFGIHPVSVSGYDRPLDVSAAWNEDRTAITVAVINATEGSRSIQLHSEGAELKGQGRKWVLTGENRWSHNRPGQAREVDVFESSFLALEDELELAPLSVTLYWLPAR